MQSPLVIFLTSAIFCLSSLGLAQDSSESSRITQECYCSFLKQNASSDLHHLFEEKNKKIVPLRTPGCLDYQVVANESASKDSNQETGLFASMLSILDAARYCNIQYKQNFPYEADATESGVYDIEEESIVSIHQNARFFYYPSKDDLIDPLLKSNLITFSFSLGSTSQEAGVEAIASIGAEGSEALVAFCAVLFNLGFMESWRSSPRMHSIVSIDTTIRESEDTIGLHHELAKQSESIDHVKSLLERSTHLTQRDDQVYAQADECWQTREHQWKHYHDLHQLLSEQKIEEEKAKNQRDEAAAANSEEGREKTHVGKFSKGLASFAQKLGYVPEPHAQIACQGLDMTVRVINTLQTIWTQKNFLQAEREYTQCIQRREDAQIRAQEANFTLMAVEQRAEESEINALKQHVEDAKLLAQTLKPHLSGEAGWRSWGQKFLKTLNPHQEISEDQLQELLKIGPIHVSAIDNLNATLWQQRIKNGQQELQCLQHNTNINDLQKAKAQIDRDFEETRQKLTITLGGLDLAQSRLNSLKEEIEKFYESQGEREIFHESDRKKFIQNFKNLLSTQEEVEKLTSQANEQRARKGDLQSLLYEKKVIVEAEQTKQERLTRRCQHGLENDKALLRFYWPEHDLVCRPYLAWKIPTTSSTTNEKKGAKEILPPSTSMDEANARGKKLFVEIQKLLNKRLVEEGEINDRQPSASQPSNRDRMNDLITSGDLHRKNSQEEKTIPAAHLGDQKESYTQVLTSLLSSYATSFQLAKAVHEHKAPHEIILAYMKSQFGEKDHKRLQIYKKIQQAEEESNRLMRELSELSPLNEQGSTNAASPLKEELARIFHTHLLRRPGKQMDPALDSHCDLGGMDTYSPASKCSSALSHKLSQPPRHDQYEISGLETPDLIRLTIADIPSSVVNECEISGLTQISLEDAITSIEERHMSLLGEYSELISEAETQRLASGGIPFLSQEVTEDSWEKADQTLIQEEEKKEQINLEQESVAMLAESWDRNNSRWEARKEAELAEVAYKIKFKEWSDEASRLTRENTGKSMSALAKQRALAPLHRSLEEARQHKDASASRWEELAKEHLSLESLDLVEPSREQQGAEIAKQKLKRLQASDAAVIARWERLQERMDILEDKPQLFSAETELFYELNQLSSAFQKKLQDITQSDPRSQGPQQARVDAALNDYRTTVQELALKSARENRPKIAQAWENRINSQQERLQERSSLESKNKLTNLRESLQNITQPYDTCTVEAEGWSIFQKEKVRLDRIEHIFKSILEEQRRKQLENATLAAALYYQGEPYHWNNLSQRERDIYHHKVAREDHEQYKIWREERSLLDQMEESLKTQKNLTISEDKNVRKTGWVRAVARRLFGKTTTSSSSERRSEKFSVNEDDFETRRRAFNREVQIHSLGLTDQAEVEKTMERILLKERALYYRDKIKLLKEMGMRLQEESEKSQDQLGVSNDQDITRRRSQAYLDASACYHNMLVAEGHKEIPSEISELAAKSAHAWLKAAHYKQQEVTAIEEGNEERARHYHECANTFGGSEVGPGVASYYDKAYETSTVRPPYSAALKKELQDCWREAAEAALKKGEALEVGNQKDVNYYDHLSIAYGGYHRQAGIAYALEVREKYLAAKKMDLANLFSKISETKRKGLRALHEKNLTEFNQHIREMNELTREFHRIKND